MMGGLGFMVGFGVEVWWFLVLALGSGVLAACSCHVARRSAGSRQQQEQQQAAIHLQPYTISSHERKLGTPTSRLFQTFRQKHMVFDIVDPGVGQNSCAATNSSMSA